MHVRNGKLPVKAGKMTAVIGAQYGSEGKGAIVRAIADEYNMHVRVGSPNAGHTIHFKGEKHVMQSIPCGWINPGATIVIGRGALLNMRLLMAEIEHVEKFYPNFRKRLMIDAYAGILDERFHEMEGGVNGEMHRRIGSTGEGVGPAREARISRNIDKFCLFHKVAGKYGLLDCMEEDTPGTIAVMQDTGHNVLLEGTQGSALSLLHSCWPYCTSVDTNAAGMLAEIGIAPARLTNVLMVARTFPIRVAGNSGPMANEITWQELSKRIGVNVEERTTVTKKVRRVGEWDDRLFRNACVLNMPTDIALTFADYIDPALYGVRDPDVVLSSAPLTDFMVEHQLLGRVSMVGTGPDSVANFCSKNAGGVS